jgi:hypothetical protein
MSTVRLVAFDLDDTLAPSKSAIDARIGDLLVALAERVEVAIISGGQLAQFTSQVVDRLPASAGSILPTCTCSPPAGRSTTASAPTASRRSTPARSPTTRSSAR